LLLLRHAVAIENRVSKISPFISSLLVCKRGDLMNCDEVEVAWRGHSVFKNNLKASKEALDKRVLALLST
jgi:hypothetical protein